MFQPPQFESIQEVGGSIYEPPAAQQVTYECAKPFQSFAEHTKILNLQQNGLNVGEMLSSDHACAYCASIIMHVATEMTTEMSNCIIKSKVLFSVMIDESTSVSSELSI